MRDLREYAKRTNIRLALGAFILVFVVGVALIWAFYGEQAFDVVLVKHGGHGLDLFDGGSFPDYPHSLCLCGH